MEEKSNIKSLFNKYLSGHYSQADLEELLLYFNSPELDRDLTTLIEMELAKYEGVDVEIVTTIGNQVANKLFLKTKPAERTLRKVWFAIAASISLFFSIGIIFINYSSWDSKQELASTIPSQIQPGSNRASIQFDDGESISLNQNQNTIISKQRGLTYADGTPIKDLKATGNITISTPKAGQYRIVLEDGTKVWLNAESQLKYPVKFNGNKRQVTAIGEAYFEVAHEKNRKFEVSNGRQIIEVLGTKFNVNNYANEESQIITLVQGSVAVKTVENKNKIVLKPGEQAIGFQGDQLTVKKVDVQDVLAWKDGLIIFKSNNLKEIFRQLERWFDVEFINVPNEIQKDNVFGMISRDVPLEDVLTSIKDNFSSIDFKIEGRRVTVLSK